MSLRHEEHRIAEACAHLVRKLITHARMGVFLLIGLSFLSFFYTKTHIGIQTETATLFSEDLPFRQDQIAFNKAFPMLDDTFTLVVESATAETADKVSNELAQRLRAHPDIIESVYIPEHHAFFKTHGLLYQPETTVQTYAHTLKHMSLTGFDPSLQGLSTQIYRPLQYSSAGLSKTLLEEISHPASLLNAALKPTLRNAFEPVSWIATQQNHEASTTALRFLQIKPKLDYTRWLPAKPAIELARELAHEFRKRDMANIRITGDKAMSFEEMKSAAQGAALASVLAFFMVACVLWFALRSWRLIGACVATLLAGLLLTAAFAATAIGNLNMISVAFAVLYIGLGVDYMIHIAMRYRELINKGASAHESLITSIHEIGPSLILCALSTSAGFYAFLPTAFSGVSELGLIAGTSMFISLGLSLTLLPMLMHSFPMRKQACKKARALPSAMHNLLNIPAKHPRTLCLITVVAAVAAIFPAREITFDEDPINLRDPKSESVSTIGDLIERNRLSPWHIHILRGDEDTAEALAAQLRTLPEVKRVVTISTLIPDEQAAKQALLKNLKAPSYREAANDPEATLAALEQLLNALSAASTLPDTPAMLKSLHSNLSAFLAQATPNLDLLDKNLKTHAAYFYKTLLNPLKASPITAEGLPAEIRERWVSPQGDYRIEVIPQDSVKTNDELRAFAKTVQAIAPDATGKLIVTQQSADAVVASFKQALIFAMIAAVVIVFAYLRTIRDTLYVLIPLALTGLFTIATMQILGLPFNFANIIALPLLLGLGVDNGIHIIHRVRTHAREQADLMRSSTARAIFFSALTTLVGFGNLAFSPHTGTASMGVLLTIGVWFTLLTTLYVLPAAIYATQRTQR